jgi:hypothetical protein
MAPTDTNLIDVWPELGQDLIQPIRLFHPPATVIKTYIRGANRPDNT